MRFLCTAKVEHHLPDPLGANDTFRVRVGCLPLHHAAAGNHFRAVQVVVSAAKRCDKWGSLQPHEQHTRIEALVRAHVQRRGVQWVHSWQPEAVEQIELDAHPFELVHDDPGDPFEITAA